MVVAQAVALVAVGVGAFFLLKNGNGVKPSGENVEVAGSQIIETAKPALMPKEMIGINQVTTTKLISEIPFEQLSFEQLRSEVTREPERLIETTFTEIPIEIQLAQRIDPNRTALALEFARKGQNGGGITAQQLTEMKIAEAQKVLESDPFNSFQLSQLAKAQEELKRFV